MQKINRIFKFINLECFQEAPSNLYDQAGTTSFGVNFIKSVQGDVLHFPQLSAPECSPGEMFPLRLHGDLHLPVNAPAELLRYLCGMFRRVKTHVFSCTACHFCARSLHRSIKAIHWNSNACLLYVDLGGLGVHDDVRFKLGVVVEMLKMDHVSIKFIFLIISPIYIPCTCTIQHTRYLHTFIYI